MRLNKFISGMVILGALAGLSACKEETKSVEYYMQHEDARMDKIKECHNTANDSENCKNANEALKEIQRKNTSIPRF